MDCGRRRTRYSSALVSAALRIDSMRKEGRVRHLGLLRDLLRKQRRATRRRGAGKEQ
ncbi:conserved hypothetical protein [Sinorhizobium medicae]|uniref:Uncharacterized protein n=1 Tax=Sinorhizobium medicae TaxID=110321 RepID=A0A508X126_9HYPH|nr:conserved hypothetical protein [Sinorhizobium medicae]